MGIRLFSVVIVVAFSAALTPAQGPLPDSAPNQAGDDPPSRAARLSFVTGRVSFEPASIEDWVAATLNRPLTTGDRLWTEAGARAELNTGSAALRLNGRTNFTFINLNDNITQIQISTGTLSVRLRRLDDQESFEIDTPQAAFSLLRPGEYRVDVNEQGDATLITVRGGQGEVSTDNQVMDVRPRQQMRVTESGDGHPVFDERDAPVGDGFDNFCMDRDRREDRSESARHVSRDMPGYADLDEHGVWREDTQYGWIWAPRVEVGWAPYHHGHWAWIAPWGWTWVDDAPWGYAPFHYGRWAFVGGAWVWVPGPAAVHPVYAPALVAWVGGPRFGLGISAGVGVAAVGWFPLGPREVWTPAYRASPRYFTQVNVSNTVVNRNVNITNVYNNVYVNKNVTNVTYANQRVSGAVMAVPQNAMGSGRPVAQAAVPLQASQVASAQVQQGPMVAPQRAAVVGGANAPTAAPPAAVMNRSVVARAAPPPATVPFSQQQAALQANFGQPLARTQLNQMQRTSVTNPTGANTNKQTSTPQRPMYRQAMSAQVQTGQTVSNPRVNSRVSPGGNSLSSPGTSASEGPLRLNPPQQVQQNQTGTLNSVQPNLSQQKSMTSNPSAARAVIPANKPASVSQVAKTPPPHPAKRPAKPEGKRDQKKRAD